MNDNIGLCSAIESVRVCRGHSFALTVVRKNRLGHIWGIFVPYCTYSQELGVELYEKTISQMGRNLCDCSGHAAVYHRIGG